MTRLMLAVVLGIAASGFFFPEHAHAQRYRRRGGAAVQRAPATRVYSQQQFNPAPPPPVYYPPERVYTHEGYNEYGEQYYITTHDEGDWKYHEGVDPEGNSFTGESFDWGDGYVTHEVEADNGKRYTGHSFDWGDGYVTYEFEDEEGNDIEFDSDDLEAESSWNEW